MPTQNSKYYLIIPIDNLVLGNKFKDWSNTNNISLIFLSFFLLLCSISAELLLLLCDTLSEIHHR